MAQIFPYTLIANPAATFTRPADITAYTAGDLVANSTSAGSVVPLSWTVFPSRDGGGWVKAVRLRIDKSDVANAQFRVHLYSAIPTFTSAGDNSAFSTVVATGYTAWLASFDVTMVMKDAAGAAGNALPGSGMAFPLALTRGTTVYGLIEALAGYTPKSASVFTAELLVEGN